MGFDHQIREFAFEAGSANDVVVNPVVIATTGFSKQDTVVFKTVFVQPLFCDFAVRFGAAGEEINNVALIEPTVDHCQSIGVRQHGAHTLWFFVRHVVADGTININEKVFDVGRQYGADTLTFFVECLLQTAFNLFCVFHN